MRGSTRILIGLILFFGSLAEIWFTTHTHSFFEIIILLTVAFIGTGFFHWRYIVQHDNGVC